MVLQVKEYQTREALEAVISAEIGFNVSENAKIESGHWIEGTRAEFAALNLGDTTTVLGVRCIITDTPTVDEVTIEERIAVPDRGLRVASGIDIND